MSDSEGRMPVNVCKRNGRKESAFSAVFFFGMGRRPCPVYLIRCIMTTPSHLKS